MKKTTFSLEKIKKIVLILLVLSTLVHAIDVSDCTTISSSGSYDVITNLEGNKSDGACITIAANNVILDCNGNTITGNTGVGETYGIYSNTRSNILIKNCNINNYTLGLLFQGGSNNNITNNTFFNNAGGFYSYSCFNFTIFNNNGYNNQISTYYLNGCNHSKLFNNSVNGMGKSLGFSLFFSHNNILINNTADNFSQYGFFLYFSNFNTLSNITTKNNTAGFQIDTSFNNTISHSLILNNYYGIYSVSGSNNTFVNNTVYNNTGGIYLEGSSYNILLNNSVISTSYHAFNLFSNSNYNIFSNNIVNYNIRGFFLTSNSNFNTISNNFVNNNVEYQAYLTSVNNNRIFNNVFNASSSQGVVYDDGSNFWNTSYNCSKPNIIGGQCIGGNFYSNYNGNDVDGDGIGESSHPIPGGSNVDSLPLTNNFSLILSINLLSPPSNHSEYYSNKNGSITFEFNTSGNTPQSQCSLYINNNLNLTNSSVLNNTNTTFTQSFSPGTYFWYINCSVGNHFNITATRNFTILQDSAPWINLLHPPNHHSTFNTTLTFEFNATDDLNSTLSCSLFINSLLNTTNSSTLNNTNTTFTLTFSPGTYSWYINCSDGINTGISATRNFSIISPNPPSIYIVSPQNNYLTNLTTIEFKYFVIDNFFSSLTCDLYINNTFFARNSSVQNNTNSSFIETLDYGTYFWKINCSNQYFSNTSQLRSLTIFFYQKPDYPCVEIFHPFQYYTTYDNYLPVHIRFNLSTEEEGIIQIKNKTYFHFLGTESKKVFEVNTLLKLEENETEFENLLVISCKKGAIDTGGATITFKRYISNFPPLIYLFFLLPLLALLKRNDLFFLCLVIPFLIPQSYPSDTLYNLSFVSLVVGILILTIFSLREKNEITKNSENI